MQMSWRALNASATEEAYEIDRQVSWLNALGPHLFFVFVFWSFIQGCQNVTRTLLYSLLKLLWPILVLASDSLGNITFFGFTFLFKLFLSLTHLQWVCGSLCFFHLLFNSS